MQRHHLCQLIEKPRVDLGQPMDLVERVSILDRIGDVGEPLRIRPGKFSLDIPVASLIPDLAVEVLSTNNTRQEMEGKLDEYFEVGVREVWYVDPRLKRVRVYETRTNLRELTEADTLESRVALPGFSLSLKELFADPVSG